MPHLVQQGKERVLDFEMNRRVETYELIMEQTGLWSRNCCNDGRCWMLTWKNKASSNPEVFLILNQMLK